MVILDVFLFEKLPNLAGFFSCSSFVIFCKHKKSPLISQRASYYFMVVNYYSITIFLTILSVAVLTVTM